MGERSEASGMMSEFKTFQNTLLGAHHISALGSATPRRKYPRRSPLASGVELTRRLLRGAPCPCPAPRRCFLVLLCCYYLVSQQLGTTPAPACSRFDSVQRAAQ
eukprot:scaffold30139_cov25-Tisochrysis_lutea.AAC.3